jgi:uncharacterized delta-60 repeat protein
MRFQKRRWIDIVFRLLALACAWIVGALANAQTAGSFDPTFGSAGRVTNLLPVSSPEGALGNTLLLQRDGKMVMGGICTAIVGNESCYARLLPNGVLDATFIGPNGNGGGKFAFQFDGGTWSSAKALALQPDGRIIVGADCIIGGVARVCLARLNSNGSFDTSFDGGVSGAGRVQYEAGRVAAMQLQSDGKLIVVSYCNQGGNGRFCVMRVNANGTYDGTFDGPDAAGTGVGTGNGRFALTLFGLGTEEPNAMALQVDGKIVVVGRCLGAAGYGMCVTRLHANGSFDLSFDGSGGSGNGRIVFTVNGVDQAVGTAVAIQPDGRIVVAGHCGNSSASYRFCGARLLLNGNFDPEFLGTTGDTPGRFRFSVLGVGGDTLRSLALQTDGRILLAGFCDNGVPMTNGNDFCFARLNSDGGFDRSFDGPTATQGNGSFAVGIANDLDILESVAVQPDGKIVAGGTCSDTCGGSCGGNAFCVARFEGGSQGYETCSLDIDGDGVIGVSDAVIHARLALGFRGSALLNGLSFAAHASRSSLTEIREYLVANCSLVSI